MNIEPLFQWAKETGLPALVVLMVIGAVALVATVLAMLGKRWLQGDDKQQKYIDSLTGMIEASDKRITDLTNLVTSLNGQLGECLLHHAECSGRLTAQDERIALLDQRLSRLTEGHT